MYLQFVNTKLGKDSSDYFYLNYTISIFIFLIVYEADISLPSASDLHYNMRKLSEKVRQS